MPYSEFDDATRRLLFSVYEGSFLVLEAMKSAALSEERRPETTARMIRQLVAAAREGHRDYETLQLRALEGIE